MSRMRRAGWGGGLAALAMTVACASTSFVSTWKAPDATKISPAGKKVAAVVMSKNQASRRAAEDALAGELTKRGAQGIASYTIISDEAAADEAKARSALDVAGVDGVVVMRPVARDQQLSTVTTMYAAPYYRGYWGGYYGYGWGGAWGTGTELRTDTVVTIETLVYSLTQNKLLWAGQSKTMNPSQVDSFVKEIVNAAANQMKKEGLL